MTGETNSGAERLTTFWRFGGGVRAVQYTVVDGLAVVEGCLILGTAEAAERSFAAVQRNPGILREGAGFQGAGIIGQRYRWPDKTVPYALDGLPNPDRVKDAIAHWEANTEIRFTPYKKADHENWVTFRDGSGCMSSVGMQGGEQFLVLGPSCTGGNCIHEIGHCLGLWHEQSRKDRDAYVRINWQCIDAGMEHNFHQQLYDGQDLGPYDYGSIMHYPRGAFSNGRGDTITVLGPDPNVVIGQRTALSAGDKAAIKALYP